jgi:putative transposase
MKPKHALHLADFDYRGRHRYSVTWCCDGRKSLFNKADVVDLALAQILRACAPSRMCVPAYCFMPDHLHLLVEGTEDDANARRFFTLAKQFSGYMHSQTYRSKLWQRYGWERVLRDDQRSEDIARHILENPVRAGIAPTSRAYPFSGSAVFTQHELMKWAYGLAE